MWVVVPQLQATRPPGHKRVFKALLSAIISCHKEQQLKTKYHRVAGSLGSLPCLAINISWQLRSKKKRCTAGKKTACQSSLLFIIISVCLFVSMIIQKCIN